MSKPEGFCLIVVDHDRKVFSVHGPMLDDTASTKAVVRVREQGRSVSCHSSVPGLTPDVVASSYGTQFRAYRQVEDALSL